MVAKCTDLIAFSLFLGKNNSNICMKGFDEIVNNLTGSFVAPSMCIVSGYTDTCIHTHTHTYIQIYTYSHTHICRHIHIHIRT